MTCVSTSTLSQIASIQENLDQRVENLLSSLPEIERLTTAARRGIIARYASVLEGNFIYWMTGAYLSARSEEAPSIIRENLFEEIRDCHPGMLRKFVLAADAFPTETDAEDVFNELMSVRLFIGRLRPVSLVLMMTFFEGFIQRFMAYLEELARSRGSAEREYTEVHGVCDVTHTRELYHALGAELAIANDRGEAVDLFEGANLLEKLLRKIVLN